MTKVQMCVDYRERFGWDMPTLKLARIIYQDNPLLFASLDSVRTALRSIEGKGGARVAIRKEVEDRPKNPYNLPQSDEAIYEPYQLDAKRLLVLSDIHIPYHSIDALTCAFDYAKGRGHLHMS